MDEMKTPHRHKHTVVSTLLFSIVIGLIISVALLLCFSFWITKKDVSKTVYPVFLFSAGLLGAAVSSALPAKRMKWKGYQTGLITGVAFGLIFTALGFILSSFSFSIKAVYLFAAILVLSVAVSTATKNIR